MDVWVEHVGIISNFSKTKVKIFHLRGRDVLEVNGFSLL